jgi:membrane associated rhomboid family serine protease
MVAGLLTNNQQHSFSSASRTTSLGLRGAVFTTLASFAVVALLHWARSRSRLTWDIRRIFIVVLLLAAVSTSFYIFAKRQWLRDLRHRAIEAASVLTGNAQSLDAATSASVILIQEVELVSRGYRM